MANKRITKKAQKKAEQEKQKRLLLRKVKANKEVLKVSDEQIEKASLRSLKSLSNKAVKIQAENRKKRRRENLQKNRTFKASVLKALGIDTVGLSVKQIDKVKLKDIETRQVTPENYPSLFYNIDFNKVYKLPKNKNFYFAFRDYAGERSFNDILSDYEKLSDNELMERLESIVSLPATYKKGVAGTSSGAAGDYKFQTASARTIMMFNHDKDEQNKRKTKRKKHLGSYKGFQVLRSGGTFVISEVTPHRLLVVANALMYNITELDRMTFYRNFYKAVNDAIPRLGKILPKPLEN